MNYKNVLNNVRALLSLEVKLAQQTLMDGITTIEAEEFAPDYSVGIVTPDGAVPMPVGEYTLPNGDILVVEKEGIISSIGPEAEEEANPKDATSPAEGNEPAPAKAKPAAAPVMAENMPKKTVETVSKETFFAEIEKIKAELMSQIDTLKAENESLKVELSENTPAATPITHNPENVVEKDSFQFASKRERTTEDVVFSKLFKN
jgi:hypothetical protein